MWTSQRHRSTGFGNLKWLSTFPTWGLMKICRSPLRMGIWVDLWPQHVIYRYYGYCILFSINKSLSITLCSIVFIVKCGETGKAMFIPNSKIFPGVLGRDMLHEILVLKTRTWGLCGQVLWNYLNWNKHLRFIFPKTLKSVPISLCGL